MARTLSISTVNVMRRVCENVTLFDVDIYFDNDYAEIVIYDDMCNEIHRACIHNTTQLANVLDTWVREYEGFVFDYSEREKPERAISQKVNDIKIKLEYDKAVFYLDEIDEPDFDQAWRHIRAAEDMLWLQWQECN